MWDLFLPAEGITKIVCKRAKVFYKTTRNDKGEREWLYLKKSFKI